MGNVSPDQVSDDPARDVARINVLFVWPGCFVEVTDDDDRGTASTEKSSDGQGGGLGSWTSGRRLIRRKLLQGVLFPARKRGKAEVL